jgi:hypothetical protein
MEGKFRKAQAGAPCNVEQGRRPFMRADRAEQDDVVERAGRDIWLELRTGLRMRKRRDSYVGKDRGDPFHRVLGRGDDMAYTAHKVAEQFAMLTGRQLVETRGHVRSTELDTPTADCRVRPIAELTDRIDHRDPRAGRIKIVEIENAAPALDEFAQPLDKIAGKSQQLMNHHQGDLDAFQYRKQRLDLAWLKNRPDARICGFEDELPVLGTDKAQFTAIAISDGGFEIGDSGVGATA